MEAALVAMALLIGLGLRLSNWHGAFPGDGRARVSGVDGWYHLRRVDLALHHGFVIPHIDHYANFPEGAVADWPPGYDLLVAFVTAGVQSFASVEAAAVGVLLSPVFGLAAVLGAALLARVHYGPGASAVAALVVAMTACVIEYTTVGRFDHQAIEPLLLLAVLGALVWAERDPRRALLLGFVMGSVCAFWPGAFVFAMIPFGAWVLAPWLGHDPGRRPLVAGSVAVATAVVLAMSSPWRFEVAYYALSLFQPLVLGAGLVIALASAALHRLGRPWLATGAAVVMGVVAMLVPPIRVAVLRGWAYLSTSEAQISTVSESASPMSRGLDYVLVWWSPLVLLLPLFVGFSLSRARRGIVDMALTVGLVGCSVLALAQGRFGPLFVAILAVVCGGVFAAAIDRLGARVWAGLLAFVALLAVSARPYATLEPAPQPGLRPVLPALDWLREHTPETPHFHEPWKQPTYGVAAHWPLGHWITWIARRPNVANPLGQTDVNLRGVRRVGELLLSEPADSIAQARAQGIRYLLLTPIAGELRSYTLQLGLDEEAFVAETPGGARELTDRLLATTWARLYLDDGAVEPLQDVRLVFESEGRVQLAGFTPAFVKVFEVVRGAELVWPCEADSAFVVAMVEAHTGRRFVHRQPVEVIDGTATARMPYATSTGAVRAERVLVGCGAQSRSVEVAEADVVLGRVVEISPP